ncbi:hypothetical protein C8J56DRAFT_1097308 [Mycena floridula]|nr:hypothetical protein C8J56DRAFT_1097308 [Mycena floridula]
MAWILFLFLLTMVGQKEEAPRIRTVVSFSIIGHDRQNKKKPALNGWHVKNKESKEVINKYFAWDSPFFELTLTRENSTPLGINEEAWTNGDGCGSIVFFNQATMFQTSETGYATLKLAQKDGADATCDVESLENSKADKRSEYSGSFLVNHEHQAETKPPL